VLYNPYQTLLMLLLLLLLPVDTGVMHVNTSALFWQAMHGQTPSDPCCCCCSWTYA
jgi:hypothetical protein